MGRDKALLELAGKPLALHAVTKLRRICAEVHILSSRPELGAFAPLVHDLHEGCGPVGGLEAGLGHARHEWNLFIPVDMPFLPSAFLRYWVRKVVGDEGGGARVAMFTVEGVPQPTCCLLHRDVAPFIREAMERGMYKAGPVLESAGRQLAHREGVDLGKVFSNVSWDQGAEFLAQRFHEQTEGDEEQWRVITAAQRQVRSLWFANLNTPEEFAEAERHSDALDT